MTAETLMSRIDSLENAIFDISRQIISLHKENSNLSRLMREEIAKIKKDDYSYMDTGIGGR